MLVAARAFPLVDFTIVGEGPLDHVLRAEAPQNVRFLGRVARSDLPALFRAADILLHPSRMEGMPKVVLEGMATGCVPIVFSQYQPDFLNTGESGLIVSTVEEMLLAVNRLSVDGELRRSIGARARLKALQFDWDVIAEMWADLFSAVLANPDRARIEGAFETPIDVSIVREIYRDQVGR